MKIIRIVNGKSLKFELTSEELSTANKEFVTNWMKETLITDFNCSQIEAEDIAIKAYQIYCRGEGDTEYESVEKAYNSIFEA